MPVIPATQKVEINQLDLWFEFSPGRKLARPHLNQLARHGGVPVVPAMGEAIGRRIMA
jgi:hypothetical protein